MAYLYLKGSGTWGGGRDIRMEFGAWDVQQTKLLLDVSCVGGDGQ